ncbi:MAG: C cytochrome precursor [Verrucomicrobiales bacterium]|nr:C cytochrome precursor [Verrucomicrobiales bacterium]|tara:strand:+ start:1688 stop:3580 length:1893 start_codon:yes stop_codon:yes gene_type:complete
MSDASSSPKRSLLKPLIAVMLIAAAASWLITPKDTDVRKLLPPVPDAELVTLRPKVEPYEGYAGSDSCRDCHEHNHQTWFESWHRTMTQEARLDNIIGNFDNVSLTNGHGQSVDLFKRDGRAWFRKRFKDILFIGQNTSREEYPIVMMTGSHHMQIYWYPAGKERTLAMMPVVYLKEDQRWVPRNSVFLMPPDGGYYVNEISRWNFTCLKCHSTNPDPAHLTDGLGRQRYDTRVSELGITCESCHGPGADHVKIHSAKDKSTVADLVDRIVDPGVMDNKKSSQVCGACHSVSNLHTNDDRWRDYKPGMDFHAKRELQDGKYAGSGDVVDEDSHQQVTFWPDGMVRVSGREFSGLAITDCYTKGELSCMSCHSVHQDRNDPRPPKEWANDQMQRDKYGNKACVQCHESKEFETPAHTHHAAGSSGSLCYNCHMPHTTYGLVKAIRSHTIKSPSVRETLNVGRPNACNLCHLDKPLAWTSKHLHEWYGHEQPKFKSEHEEVAQSVLETLRGDASLRALAAWHMSWKPAVEASKAETWVQPYLARLLKDPYDAVRYIAARSLRTFDGHRGFEYDYIAGAEQLEQFASQAHADWDIKKAADAPPTVLIGKDGKLHELFEELFAQRNDVEISLLE